jgi:hypothetical protein
MADALLTPFWIVPPNKHGPLGFGVTAWSLDDALGIIRVMGHGCYLPADLEELTVHSGITVGELHPLVVAHMGPIVVRGMWYPFRMVGVPR